MIRYRAHRGTLAGAVTMATALLLNGCQNPNNSTNRGYTKDPLEHAG